MSKSIADITEQVITRTVELREAEEKWRMDIEHQLRCLSDANDALRAQVEAFVWNLLCRLKYAASADKWHYSRHSLSTCDNAILLSSTRRTYGMV